MHIYRGCFVGPASFWRDNALFGARNANVRRRHVTGNAPGPAKENKSDSNPNVRAVRHTCADCDVYSNSRANHDAEAYGEPDPNTDRSSHGHAEPERFNGLLPIADRLWHQFQVYEFSGKARAAESDLSSSDTRPKLDLYHSVPAAKRVQCAPAARRHADCLQLQQTRQSGSLPLTS